jgi:hypothetical protein
LRERIGSDEQQPEDYGEHDEREHVRPLDIY